MASFAIILHSAFLLLHLVLGMGARAASFVPAPGPRPTAPPPDPPSAVRLPASSGTHRAAAANVPYSIGDPTDEEQLYLELINRARADPIAEAARLTATTDPDVLGNYESFEVDLALMASQFAGLAPVPPLSMNAQLLAAARRHSQDMLEHEFQDHPGSDGSTPGQRITDAGYNWTGWSENVFAYAKSVWQGHAALNVDWGPGPGGMQDPPGHRRAIHNASHREIGIGVVLGRNGTVGPQLVTQDFGSAAEATPFITGAVYYDFNGNQFYDLGEGVGGVTVTVTGAARQAITARSGGYSVPVPGDATYSLTFKVSGLADLQRSVVVADAANEKVDNSLVYQPPTITGAAVASVNQNNRYPFTLVGGATAYDWRSLRRRAWTIPEGAEEGAANVTAATSAGYDVVANDVKQSGNASFHLAQPDPPVDQFLTLNRLIRLGPASQLSFFSRLGWASATQVARAQVSADGGATWVDLWSQAGTDGAGDVAFIRREVSLAAFAGQTIRIRFAYRLTAGTFFPQTDAGVGLYVDDIFVSDAEELTDEAVAAAATDNSFTFRPEAEGAYALQVRARIGDRFLPWGPLLAVTAQTGGSVVPIVRLITLSPEANGTLELRFRLEAGDASAFQVQGSAGLMDDWTSESGVQIENSGVPGEFRAVLAAGPAAVRFFRVAVP